MTKENFKTKCPYCQIGFGMMCESQEKAIHMDIMWTSESGQIFECHDLEAIKPHIIKNDKYGTGYSLSPEMDAIFKELNTDFHTDPSKFNKDNVEIGDAMGMMGEFVRYSDFMDNRGIREDLDPMEVAEKMWEEGKNMQEIINEITEVNVEQEENS